MTKTWCAGVLALCLSAAPASAGPIIIETTKIAKFEGSVTEVINYGMYLPGLEVGMPVTGFSFWSMFEFDDDEGVHHIRVGDPFIRIFVGPYTFGAGGGFVFPNDLVWPFGWGVQGGARGPLYGNLRHDSITLDWDPMGLPFGYPPLPGTPATLTVDAFDFITYADQGAHTYSKFSADVVIAVPDAGGAAFLLLLGISPFVLCGGIRLR